MELLRAASARRALKWQSAMMRPKDWVCQSCLSRSIQSRSQSRRSFAIESAPSSTSKPYYITTPIFYVNASPHVGHMYTMVLADVLKRWQTLAGKRALLCTGTDEHGLKVQQAAAKEDVPPMQWCDENSDKFKSLAEVALIDYDRFIRTTDADHIDAVQHFWFLLENKGYIYESKHEGWYCVSDECFYPESMIEKMQDPFTGEKFLGCIETGNRVEWVEEKNYHFHMTALKDRLLQFYRENPEWVVPAARMNEVVDWVTNNLEDLSISRPANRLNWAIKVPNDQSQTIYVWVDALINYLTFAGFPNWTPGQRDSGGWPADVHVIGKDIVRFHCVYWPALLLALDLPLPKKVLSHAHWTMDHRKMSKSIGNVVNPFGAIERFGLDAVRFYMIYDGGIGDDADYSNQMISARYKKLLQDGMGNLTARLTRAKIWRLPTVLKTVRDRMGVTGQFPSEDETCLRYMSMLDEIAPSASRHMDKLNPGAALRELMVAIDEANGFITWGAPWNLLKKGDEAAQQLGYNVVFLTAETLRIVGILLQPFMPDKSAELLDLLGVSPEKRTLQDARLCADMDYGPKVDRMEHGRFVEGTLFPGLSVKD